MTKERKLGDLLNEWDMANIPAGQLPEMCDDTPKRTHDDKNVYEFKAELLWRSFTDNDKAGVRCGLFPFCALYIAGKEGYDEHRLCVALLDVASRN